MFGKKFAIPSMLLLVLILNACSSGKQSLQRGNYYDAVMQAVNRLRAKPNQKKAIETLRSGYPLSIDWYLDQANNALASNDPQKWRRVVSSYERMNNLYEAIKRSPGALNVIPNPKNFYKELVDSKNNAAEESYQEGLAAFDVNTRESAKKAYFCFIDADRYVPGYKDTQQRMQEAKFHATLKVVVNHIPVPSLRYQVTANFFQEKVQEYLNSFNTNEFVRYYTPLEAEREKLERPDQILKLQFQDFVVGETHVKEKVESLSKENVKVGEFEVTKDSIVDVMGTVKAKLTTFRKEVISTGVLNMVVFDARSENVLTSQNFSGQFAWLNEWGNFNGDQRALTKDQVDICKQSEIPPPPPQDLFIGFTEPIYNQLTNGIRSFYSRY